MGYSEQQIRRAIEQADLNVLRVALYQATGDESLARMALRQIATRGGSVFTYVVDERHRAELIDKAVNFMLTSGETFRETVPSDDDLRRLMELLWNQPISDKDFAYRRPIAAFEEFPRAAAWSDQPSIPAGFEVAIIGAGFSGIAVAAQMEQLGIPYFLLERRAEVGGTWSINVYPDARVDTHSYGYQYSFEKRYPWSEYYARQPEVREYIEHVARQRGILGKIEFENDLREARFNKNTNSWELEIDTPAGRQQREASVLICATGLFSTPNTLDIPGMETFQGEIVHSTKWRDDIQVEGRRVAVVGNGSTGVQLLASIATRAKAVSVYQRTPQWISVRENYGKQVPPEVRWLHDHFPYYWNWTIYATVAMVVEAQELQEVDPAWQRAGGLVSERNDRFRASMIEYIKSQVGERPELLDKLIPTHAPMARRLIIDNGWYKALLRDNVELVTEKIAKFSERDIVTADGRKRETNLVVAAVGFSTTKYLWPARFRGRADAWLDEVWSRDRGPRAYLGMTIPEFPNLFILYGPNAQPRTGASLQSWMECWARYVASSVVMLLERRATSISVRREVFERYNAELDAASERLVWADPNSSERNYYVNEWGRQQVNAPWRVEDYYAMLEAPDPADFEFGLETGAPAMGAAFSEPDKQTVG